MEIYKVKSIGQKDIILSGKGNQSFWNESYLLTNFCSPWDDQPLKKIEFKAVHNSEKIFFQFKVYDQLVHIHSSENKNDSINNSDRVELFFRSDAYLDPYYCLEIDTLGRVMDFKAKPNKEFDFNWNWPFQDIDVKSSRYSNHFIVEIAITLSSFIELNLLKNGCIETGIYRAKYHKQKNHKFDSTWITWVNPKTKKPNFHIKSSFGVLKLEDYQYINHI